MDDDDWDLFSIVRSCNTTTFTTPTTNFENPPPPQIKTTTKNIIFSQSTTPFCFDDFTFNQENSSVSFTPLNPNDFIDLDKLKTNFNLNLITSTPATTTIPKINTTSSPTTTTYTIPSPLTTTIPTHNTSVHVIHTPTILTPTIPPNITPIITATTTTFITPTTTTPTISTTSTTITNTSVHENNQYPANYNFPTLAGQQQIQQNINNQASILKPVQCIDITTAHFDRAYNHPSVALCRSRKRKHNNQMAFVCYMMEDELSKDPWAWRKYGQKLIKGSPHPRSYYKCSTWSDCPSRRKVEKCKTQENTYIVTYEGEHNHAKPTINKNVVVGTSKHKSPKTGLHTTEEAGSSTNITNSGSPNVVMLHIDPPEGNNAQVLVDQSKTPYPEMDLLEIQLPVVEEVGSSSNVRNLCSHNKMILQFDEPPSSIVTGVVGDSNLSYPETGFIGNFDDNDDDDDILIPNITAWSEDYLMDFNRLNGGALFP